MGFNLSISESARQVLREVGLSTYEIDAYVALLKGGQMTAIEISRSSSVPYSKIYGVLKSLKEKGWIKSFESRPSNHYPVPPSEAVAIEKVRFEDRYKSWEQVIVSELQPLYEKRELVEHPDMLILHGQQGITAKLEETLKKATKEIMVAAPEFAKTIVTSATFSLETLQKTRANVKLMVAGKTVDWMFLKGLAGLGEVRIRDEMFGGGVIIDGKEAMLFLGEEKPSLVIWSNHTGLVRFAREYFQFLWDSSEKI